MARCNFFFVLVLFSCTAFAQSRQVFFGINYRHLQYELIKNTYSDSYSLGKAEGQFGYRFPVGVRFAGTLGLNISGYQRAFHTYPHVLFPHSSAIRVHSTTLSHAISLRPSLGLHFIIPSASASVLLGARVFVNGGVQARKYFHRRLEYYSWDSLGNMNQYPDSVVVVMNDWHDFKIRIQPQFGAEFSAVLNYPIGVNFNLFAEGTIGAVSTTVRGVGGITYSLGVGISRSFGNTSRATPDVPIFQE